jgi:5-methylthioadenosine/S-adenosylhomocysteine deaminase
MFHVISQLIYATGRHQVSDVWIAGRRKLIDRRLPDIDTDAVLARTRAWRERIAVHC